MACLRPLTSPLRNTHCGAKLTKGKVEPKLLFLNNFPMAAFVRANTTEETGFLQSPKMALDAIR